MTPLANTASATNDASAPISPDTDASLGIETVEASVRRIAEDLLEQLPLLVTGLIIVLAALVTATIARRAANRLLRNVSLRHSLKELISRLTYVLVIAAGLLIAAMVAFPGLTPSKALTALGIGSIAIGLAFKDIFENLFAGVLILWRFPFENGDFIACGDFEGRVVDVTVRNTLIRTVRNELLVVPNADIYKNAVYVYTNKPTRRLEIICGVAYDEDVATARDVIAKAVASCESVSEAPTPEIFAQAFSASSVDFEIAWWTGPTPREQRASRDEVVEAVRRGLDQAGIRIPFPHRTLVFREDAPLHIAGAATNPTTRAGESSDGP